MIITDVQFVGWARKNLDLVLDLGDLAAGIQEYSSPHLRFPVLILLVERLLPDIASLINSPKCDTLSFDEAMSEKRALLADLTELAGRRGLKAIVSRGRQWLDDLQGTVRILMLLLEP